MEYVQMEVEFGSLLPATLKVPQDAETYAEFVLKRLCEPNEGLVPGREINARSKQGLFRLPEYCYGFKAHDSWYGGPMIGGTIPELDHTLDLFAGYDISRIQGRSLIKLLIARRFVEGNPNRKRITEEEEMFQSLDDAVKKAWKVTMN